MQKYTSVGKRRLIHFLPPVAVKFAVDGVWQIAYITALLLQPYERNGFTKWYKRINVKNARVCVASM